MSKKVVRLTESQLRLMINKVIKEQADPTNNQPVPSDNKKRYLPAPLKMTKNDFIVKEILENISKNIFVFVSKLNPTQIIRVANNGFQQYKYNINNSDFIVKMTGRYILDDNSEFMNVIKNIHNTNYDCIIRYGAYFKPANYKTNDCITGLIGMSCLYIKQIEKPNEDECVEWKWAKVTYLIDNKNIYLVNNLGISLSGLNVNV